MNTEKKVSILKEMRKRIESGIDGCLCNALNAVTHSYFDNIRLSDLGITRPYNAGHPYWFPEFLKEPRLKLIDEALAKCETDPIKEAEQRVKDAQAELERLKNTPKDVEELYGGQTMYYIDYDGQIEDDIQYCPNNYLSKERAEKELLRIRLAFIADSLNGGLFEPTDGEYAYFLYCNRTSGTVTTSDWLSASVGQIYFKTRELAKQAITYFTKDELKKMLS